MWSAPASANCSIVNRPVATARQVAPIAWAHSMSRGVSPTMTTCDPSIDESSLACASTSAARDRSLRSSDRSPKPVINGFWLANGSQICAQSSFT